MKILEMEYFLLPEDRSHIRSFLYRFPNEEKDYSDWKIGYTSCIQIDNKGPLEVMTEFAVKYSNTWFIKCPKIKVKECKIVRVKCQKKSKKSV